MTYEVLNNKRLCRLHHHIFLTLSNIPRVDCRQDGFLVTDIIGDGFASLDIHSPEAYHTPVT